jgi:hypothetical protein
LKARILHDDGKSAGVSQDRMHQWI